MGVAISQIVIPAGEWKIKTITIEVSRNESNLSFVANLIVGGLPQSQKTFHIENVGPQLDAALRGGILKLFEVCDTKMNQVLGGEVTTNPDVTP